MKGYVVNLSKGANFEGIVIIYDSIEEGLSYAQANRIDKVCIKCNINDGRKKRINFDFLRGMEFVKTFHWLVPLDKRSNIDGMRILQNVEELRWVAGSNIGLDLSPFGSLKSLNIQFSSAVTGWEHLLSLKELMLSAVDESSLCFLRGLDIKRYGYNDSKLYLINTHNGIKENGIPAIDIKEYPSIKAHLDSYWELIEKRADQGDTPYNLRNCAYLDE